MAKRTMNARELDAGCSVQLWCAAMQALDELHPRRGFGERDAQQVNQITRLLTEVERIYQALPTAPDGRPRNSK